MCDTTDRGERCYVCERRTPNRPPRPRRTLTSRDPRQTSMWFIDGDRQALMSHDEAQYRESIGGIGA